MKLEVGKKYRDRAGNVAEILKMNLLNDYPCVGFITDKNGDQFVRCWLEDGRYSRSQPSPGDLVSETTPYDDFEIDEKVVVWNDNSSPCFRYFAGLYEGYPAAWANGATSWSSKSKTKVKWGNCIKYSEYIPEAYVHQK